MSKSPPESLSMSSGQVDAIRQFVLSGAPEEVCGFMAGVGGQVSEIIPVPNISEKPQTGFRMEPQAQLRALIKIEGLGWDLIAIYHSHPTGGLARPSPVDLASAFYPNALMVIVVPDLVHQTVEIRAFAITDGAVSECPVVIAPN